jgi:hypothetical protein
MERVTWLLVGPLPVHAALLNDAGAPLPAPGPSVEFLENWPAEEPTVAQSMASF